MSSQTASSSGAAVGAGQERERGKSGSGSGAQHSSKSKMNSLLGNTNLPTYDGVVMDEWGPTSFAITRDLWG